MSWLYSQALVAAYSEDTCSDGEPFAPLSGNPSPQAYCAPDKMKAFSRLSRFGTTFKPLTASRGEAVLTSFLADFPAKTLAPQEKAQASTASAAECGDIWPESFARWNPDSCSWKTPQCSLLAGLDEFSETWPRWGMMQGGECSVQSMPEHLTNGTGSGLWVATPTATANQLAPLMQKHSGCRAMMPTPTRSDYRSPNPNPAKSGQKQEPSSGHALPAVVAKMERMWLTPSASEHHAGKAGGKMQVMLAHQVQTWPTVTASDWKGAALDRAPGTDKYRGNLCEAAELHGGKATQQNGKVMRLNPTWVEWLMGWPLGWTDLKPLEMDKFQQWQHSHGKF